MSGHAPRWTAPRPLFRMPAVGSTMQGTKTKAARAKAGRSGAAPSSRARASQEPSARVGAVSFAGAAEALLESLFEAVPDVPAVNGHASVPDVVRKNRRERARRRLVDALRARGEHPLSEARSAELGRLVERWAQKRFADAFPEADDFEMSCAQEGAALEAAARGDEKERFAAAERAHRDEVVRRHGWIEIRGLQLSERVRKELDVVYVPLHVEDRSAVPSPPPAKKAAATKKKRGAKNGAGAASEVDVEVMLAMVRALDRPRVPATGALAKHTRLFVFGAPGSGKSTWMAYLATRAALRELAVETGWPADPVPFLVHARSVHEARVTVEVLARGAGVEPWFLEAALGRGSALLLIDGIDEARPEVGRSLMECVTGLLEAHPQVRAVVTSRPSAMAGDDEPVPEGFVRVRLLPMTPGEVSTFVDKWCLAAELSLGKSETVAVADARAAAEDLKERIREKGAIEKLAQTPLLCSVICVVHRFLGQRIPARRVALYEAITNVLLYEWDRAKFPDKPDAVLGKLDAHAKRALLSRLARAMHLERAAEWPAEKVIASFEEKLPDLGYEAGEAAGIVAEIRDRNGVLVERSPGSFAFSHMTFQEYLAAMEMVNRREYGEMLQRYRDGWWHEVIVLAAGFPGAEVTRLVRSLLAADKGKVGEGTMLAAQCAETAIDMPAALRAEIDERVAKVVPPRSAQGVQKLAELGDVAGPILLRSLASASADAKVNILRALRLIGYEPANSAFRRLMRDPARMMDGTKVALWTLILFFGMAAKRASSWKALLEELDQPNPELGPELTLAFRGELKKLIPLLTASSSAATTAARSG